MTPDFCSLVYVFSFKQSNDSHNFRFCAKLFHNNSADTEKDFLPYDSGLYFGTTSLLSIDDLRLRFGK